MNVYELSNPWNKGERFFGTVEYDEKQEAIEAGRDVCKGTSVKYIGAYRITLKPKMNAD